MEQSTRPPDRPRETVDKAADEAKDLLEKH